MLKVALVGNIASGKSTVEKALQTSGYVVLDTDKVCHELLTCDEVSKEFSTFDVFENGIISREKLGKLVFANVELKKRLEDILYPMVRLRIAEFFEQYNAESLVFVAIPLLFEAGMVDLFDKIVFVYCDDDIRLKRLTARNNYTEEYAKIRMGAQQSQDEKIKKSDYVIYNNSTIEALDRCVDSVVNELLNL
ncbi:dephospho-CoA kinase [bacterium]|nr:dephospho-CoA kinase [bacterium]